MWRSMRWHIEEFSHPIRFVSSWSGPREMASRFLLRQVCWWRRRDITYHQSLITNKMSFHTRYIQGKWWMAKGPAHASTSAHLYSCESLGVYWRGARYEIADTPFFLALRLTLDSIRSRSCWSLWRCHDLLLELCQSFPHHKHCARISSAVSNPFNSPEAASDQINECIDSSVPWQWVGV